MPNNFYHYPDDREVPTNELLDTIESLPLADLQDLISEDCDHFASLDYDPENFQGAAFTNRLRMSDRSFWQINLDRLGDIQEISEHNNLIGLLYRWTSVLKKISPACKGDEGKLLYECVDRAEARMKGFVRQRKRVQAKLDKENGDF